MQRSEFTGSITTTGRSEALRLDKALFKAHPEFRQRAKIRASVVGPGSLLVTLDAQNAELPGTDAIERDPVIAAYLSFIERDLHAHPERLRPILETDVIRLSALTAKVKASDSDTIPDDVTL
jgi:antitoxin PrlF